MAAVSALVETSDLTTFSITSGGQEVSDLYEVLSIHVSKAVNRIPTARIVLRDGSAPLEGFPASESDDFAPGAAIEIEAGYHFNNGSIFSGIIVKQSLRQRRGGPSQLVVECRASAIKMTVGRKSAYHGEQTDSDLLSALIGSYGLEADVASTSPQLPWITQFNTTDWDFTVIRAQINGLLVIADGGKVSIQAPDWSQEPTLSVTYGADLLEFHTDLDAATQFAGVEGTAWDMSSQQTLTAQVSAGNVNTLGSDTTSALAGVLAAGAVQLPSTAPLAQAQLQSWAEAAMLKSELSKIRGKLRLQGTAEALPGSLLEVDGLGKRFDGAGFIGGVTHEIEGGNWTTEVSLGVDPAWFATERDISPPPASAQLPPARGLQIGVVQKIDADPAGELRVQVTLPVIASEGAVIWARLGNFYATNGAGSFFYPEIGDEVVLGFLDEDPRFPVIVGSLYSAGRAAPYPPDADNSQKAIVTNAKLRILFDDKNKVLTLQTPAQNQLVFSDQDKAITLSDQHGNTIKLSSSGIEVTSAGDLTMKAAQNLSGEAQAGAWTIKGAQGVSVSGLKVSLEADTQFSASGKATASLQSNGETTVKGTMVMIN